MKQLKMAEHGMTRLMVVSGGIIKDHMNTMEPEFYHYQGRTMECHFLYRMQVWIQDCAHLVTGHGLRLQPLFLKHQHLPEKPQKYTITTIHPLLT